MIVLGSGGHTTEMLMLLPQLLSPITGTCVNIYPRIYIHSIGDEQSRRKASEFEGSFGSEPLSLSIPRARQVGQSYITSIFTTLKSLYFAFALVREVEPDLILCNGPGVCVPICISALMLRRRRRTRIVFIESMARVSSLSLSGRILYHLSDLFIVQWPYLAELYPKAHFINDIFSLDKS